MAKFNPSEVVFNVNMGPSEYETPNDVVRMFLSLVDTDRDEIDNLGEWNIKGLPPIYSQADHPMECLSEWDPKELTAAQVVADMIAAGFIHEDDMEF